MPEQRSYMHLVRPNVAAPGAPAANGPLTVKIQAPALFQILEIVSKQVLYTDKRIIGTLLGSRSDDLSEFEIKHAFMVPCNETGDSVTIEDHTHKTLYQLYKKAHPKDAVLGWFGSSSTIDNTTGLIHDFYSKGSDRAYPYPAIYLNVDYLKDNRISEPKLSTYIGAAVGKPVSGVQLGWKANINNYIFTPIPNEVISSSVTEKIALNNLREKSVNTASFVLDSAEDASFLSAQLEAVTSNIDKLLAEILNVDNSDANLDLLRLLSNNLLNKPQLLTNLPELERLFSAHNQDVTLIEYLTKVIKEQIELSARLTATAEAEKKY